MSTKFTVTNTTENTRWRTTTPTTPQIMKLGLEGARQLTTILTMNERLCLVNEIYAMSRNFLSDWA